VKTNKLHKTLADSMIFYVHKILEQTYEPVPPDMPIMLKSEKAGAIEKVFVDKIGSLIMATKDHGILVVCKDQLKTRYPDADIPVWALFVLNKETSSYDII
jgi:hypothetical protein